MKKLFRDFYEYDTIITNLPVSVGIGCLPCLEQPTYDNIMARFCEADFGKTRLSLVVRKPVFGVSDQVRHKPGFTDTEDG